MRESEIRFPGAMTVFGERLPNDRCSRQAREAAEVLGLSGWNALRPVWWWAAWRVDRLQLS
jgi:hypothetical protein